jgi:hypothetical protein
MGRGADLPTRGRFEETRAEERVANRGFPAFAEAKPSLGGVSMQ